MQVPFAPQGRGTGAFLVVEEYGIYLGELLLLSPTEPDWQVTALGKRVSSEKAKQQVAVTANPRGVLVVTGHCVDGIGIICRRAVLALARAVQSRYRIRGTSRASSLIGASWVAFY